MADTLKHKMLSGMFWSGMGQVWNYGVNFTISIILARLLAPEEFGVVAIIGVFTAIFCVFIDSGLGSALIQKKDLQPEDCSSVFFVNLTMAVVLYTALFFASPWIAEFYHKPILTRCIRVSALTMIIGALSAVQNTMMYRELRMNIFFRISLISQSVSGIVGVVMAFRGFGVWALVTQTLLKSIISTTLLWFWGTWRPIFVISFTRLKGLFQFGWKMFSSSILDTAYNNIYPLLFGKLFDFSTLAYYNRGNNLPNLGMGIINNTISSTLFPAFSSIQNDRTQMARVLKKIQSGIFFCVIPAMTLLFITSEPLVILLYKEKWLPAVPYMQIFCLFYVFWPFHTSNLCVIQACGRSDVFLVLEIIKKVQLLFGVLLTYRHGPLAMAYGVLAVNLLCAIENAWMNRKLINFGFGKQILNILPYTVISLICAVPCWYLCKSFVNIWARTFLTSFCFGILYLGISFFLKLIPQDMIQFIATKIPFMRKQEA